MANKKINQLDTRTGAALTDLILIGDPTSGTSFKLTATDFKTLLNNVPYTGATTNVNLGEFGLLTGQLTFDQTPTGTAGVGVMRWNDSDGTVDLGLKGGNVTLQVGQELVQRVVNKSGINLLEANYQVVRVSDAQGQRLAVQLAQGNNDANSTDTIGIVTETINDNQEGFVTTSGLVRNINTTGSLQGETWVDGDVLYLSPTVAGRITKVKPTAPNHSVILGYVVYAHANNGKIFVKVDNGYEIGELHDVYAPTPSNNDGIFWNTANSRYQNNSIAGVLGYTPISGSGVTGQVSYWNGTNSQTGSNNLFWDAANARLGIGTSTPTYTTQILRNHNASTSIGVTNTTSGTSSLAEIFCISSNGYIALAKNSALRTIYKTLLANDGYIYNATAGDISILNDVSGGNIKFASGASSTAQATLFSTGNFIVGGTTDGGQRLQVIGDTLLRGSGATSATNGLLIQNSASANIFNFRNDGTQLLSVVAGQSLPVFIIAQRVTATNQNAYIRLLRYGNTDDANQAADFLGFYNASNLTGFRFQNGLGTGGGVTFNFIAAANIVSSNVVTINQTFNPTSGTDTITQLLVSPTINQTGGANGITRGLYVNPTLTAAADWRSIEWSNNSGWGLYGAGTANNYLGGRLGIGTTSPSYTLDVRATTGFVAASFKSQYTAVGYLGGDNTAAWMGTGTDGLVNAVLCGTTTNYVSFFTNSSERGRIHNSGNWSVGNSIDAGYKLDVLGSIRSSAGGIIFTSTNSGFDAFYTLLSGNIKFYVSCGGNLKATSTILTDANGATTISASAILEAVSTTKGFLPPRMTTTQKNAISSPAAGLQVYDSTLNQMSYYNGTTWVNF